MALENPTVNENADEYSEFEKPLSKGDIENPGDTEDISQQIADQTNSIQKLTQSIDSMIAGLTKMLEGQTAVSSIERIPAKSLSGDSLSDLKAIAKIAGDLADRDIATFQAGAKAGWQERDTSAGIEIAQFAVDQKLEKLEELEAIVKAGNGTGKQVSEIIETMMPVIKDIAGMIRGKPIVSEPPESDE